MSKKPASAARGQDGDARRLTALEQKIKREPDAIDAYLEMAALMSRRREPGMAAQLEVDVQTGTAPVTLRMQPTRRVRIRVRDHAGLPVPEGYLQGLKTVSVDFGRELAASGRPEWDLLPGRYDTRFFGAERTAVASPPIVVEAAPPGDDAGVEVVLRLPPAPESSTPK